MMKVMLDSIKDVEEFVKITNKFPESVNVELKSGRYIIDGKSIMGVFSLDLSKPVELVIEGGDNPMDTSYCVKALQKYLFY